MTECKTISQSVCTELAERHSQFIGYARSVSTEEDAIFFLDKIRQKHWDVSHNVYAYSLRGDQLRRYSDDGEPQDTAGIPVLEVLQKPGIIDATTVMTHYFGGVLLDAGGLVHAYSHTTSLGIQAAKPIVIRLCQLLGLSCDYSQYGILAVLIPECDGVVDDSDLTETITLRFHTAQNDAPSFYRWLADTTDGAVKAEQAGGKYSEWKQEFQAIFTYILMRGLRVIIITVGERTQLLEEQILSPYATLSKRTQGRDRPEGGCKIRTLFQRDRDCIVHCKAFRRLKHKTQASLSPEGDHYRTRLTHILEILQIARTIAHGLLLNEDLTGAISLGCDLGRTPFDHTSEQMLNELCEHGFRYNEQSVRVVEKFKNGGRGLNLTKEVHNGTLCRTSGAQTQTPEGRIVRLANKIAYINHDIDDTVRAGVLSEWGIPEHITNVFGTRRSVRVGTLVKPAIRASGGAEIRMEKHISPSFLELCRFIFEKVYFNPYAEKKEEKVPFLVRTLFEYTRNPMRLPLDLRGTAEPEGTERAVTDFITGMTDRHAVALFQDISTPRSWGR